MKIDRVSSSLVVMSLHWLCLYNYMFVVSSLCLDNQQSLLLQLQNNLTFSTPSPPITGKLKSWNTSDDCCNWMGVTCDEEGHVTGLDLSGQFITGGIGYSSSLFCLQHLQNLNLAENFFNYTTIPSGLDKLHDLRYLNLSYAAFAGQIPVEISWLTRLVTLDLSSQPWDVIEHSLKLENPNLEKLLQNLTSIRKLYLDGVSITASGKEWSNALLSLRNLQELSMYHCNLSGPLDSSLSRLENLTLITLDCNNFSSPVPETFGNFKNLTYLSLVECGLNGTLPNSLSNLTELSYLNLRSNNFIGPMPSFGMAKKLTYLDLYNNSFSGAISSSCRFERLQNLVHIDLSHNLINGSIPSSLFTLPLLQEIYLSHNHFSQLDEFIHVTSSMLRILDLSHNDILGPFPVFLFQLNAISVLDLYSNKFSGSVQLVKLLKLKNLTDLNLSYNNLTVNADVTNYDPSFFAHVDWLELASCNLKSFPDFLRNGYLGLDLSNNQIQGIVPSWIWRVVNLRYINISHNLLTNFEQPLQNICCRGCAIDAHNNQLTGPIPIPYSYYPTYLDYSRNKFSSILPQNIGNDLSFTYFLSLSHNSFHGSIPDSLCNALQLQVLDLSINNFSGTIPPCLMMTMINNSLKVLNLQGNNLTGRIPDMFQASCSLKSMNLHGNSLDGPIPISLGNCSKLEVLDLGKNQLIGGFPCFLKNISTLGVLVLRNNKFQGSLECSNAWMTWNMLQILDAAFNNFSGKLPRKFFLAWETMMHDENQSMSKFDVQFGSSYYEVAVVNKGQPMELSVEILNIFTLIDLSSNHFEGSILDELMDFKALHALNLSNNAFSGEIPSSIGNLKNIESLDFSMNNLHGAIPVQLASLSFLSYLNLSFNHLQGKIPTGTQLQSFQASSFEGNDGLYGPPLTEEPNLKKQGLQPRPSSGRITCKIDCNFLSAEIGLVFGLGVVFFPLLLWKSWRIRYWRFVDKVLCIIFPQMYLDYVTQRAQTYSVLRW